MNKVQLPVPNLKAGFLAIATYLIGGGVEQLETRLSRQVMGWFGALFIIASTIGVWGIYEPFVLTLDDFYIGLGAGLSLLGFNYLDNRVVANKPPQVGAGQ